MSNDARPAATNDALMTEHALLVSRGVRTLAEVGNCHADDVAMLRAATLLEGAAIPGAIPFVIDRDDGTACYGFAAARWAVDLFRWLITADANAVPEEQVHRVRGLLHGFSPQAIREFEESRSGRQFRLSESAGSAAS